MATDLTPVVAGAGTLLGAAFAAGLAAWANRKGKAAGEASPAPSAAALAMSTPGQDRMLLEAITRLAGSVDVGNALLDDIKDEVTRSGERTEKAVDRLADPIKRAEEATRELGRRMPPR